MIAASASCCRINLMTKDQHIATTGVDNEDFDKRCLLLLLVVGIESITDATDIDFRPLVTTCSILVCRFRCCIFRVLFRGAHYQQTPVALM